MAKPKNNSRDGVSIYKFSNPFHVWGMDSSPARIGRNQGTYGRGPYTTGQTILDDGRSGIAGEGIREQGQPAYGVGVKLKVDPKSDIEISPEDASKITGILSPYQLGEITLPLTPEDRERLGELLTFRDRRSLPSILFGE